MENNDDERTLRYLRGEMPEDEQIAFEEELKQNPELEKTYYFHKQIAEAAAYRFKQEKKAMLQALDNEKSPEQETGAASKSRISKFAIIGGIGGLAAAVGLILFLLLPGQSPKALADQHFKPFPDYVTERYRGPADNASQTSDEKVFKKGMTAYRASSYEKAAILLRQAIDQNQQKALSKLYLANALMASDKPGKAIQHLEGLKDKLKPDYQMQQQWYLALAYVKTGQFSKAQPLLDKLTKREIFQHQEAAQALRNAIE